MFNIAKAVYRGALREPFIRKRGTGVGSHGRHTKRGNYLIDLKRLGTTSYLILEGFKLTPYVSHRTPQIWKTCKPEDFLPSSQE